MKYVKDGIVGENRRNRLTNDAELIVDRIMYVVMEADVCACSIRGTYVMTTNIPVSTKYTYSIEVLSDAIIVTIYAIQCFAHSINSVLERQNNWQQIQLGLEQFRR